MLDEETSREVDRIAREAAEAAQRGGSGADVLAAIYELQARLADVGHSYGMDGGDAVPGNFEPEFADDNGTMKLDSVGEGYWPFGRQFSNVVTVDSSAKIAHGFIYLEITHPVPSSSGAASTPSATIKGVTPDGTLPSFWNTDTTKSLIPMYRIYNGAITVDFRSCMSLTMREL